MSEEIKIEDSSGNVFLDIGFSKEEAEREQLRVVPFLSCLSSF